MSCQGNNSLFGWRDLLRKSPENYKPTKRKSLESMLLEPVCCKKRQKKVPDQLKYRGLISCVTSPALGSDDLSLDQGTSIQILLEPNSVTFFYKITTLLVCEIGDLWRITWFHIQSVWNHSGPSEVPYPTNKLVVRNFFCYFLQQTGSRLVVLKLGYHCKGVKNVYIVNTENVQTTDHATHILQLFFWFRLGRTSLISAAICQCCCKKKE